MNYIIGAIVFTLMVFGLVTVVDATSAAIASHKVVTDVCKTSQQAISQELEELCGSLQDKYNVEFGG